MIAGLLGITVTTVIVLTACDDMGGGGGFGRSSADGERWRIQCIQASTEDARQLCEVLAEKLRNVPGIDPDLVQVETHGRVSTLYYGEYIKSKSSPDGGLAFSQTMRNDIARLRTLSLGQTAPFANAMPVPYDQGGAGATHPWHVSNCTGTHTLEIMVTFNTPTFDQRQEAAEEYVKLLREDGFKAYFYHEQVKSYVYVGDFTESDIIALPTGGWRYSQRVQDLIAQRPEEFSYHLENGFLRKYPGSGGQMEPVPSRLVEVPVSRQSGQPEY